MNDSGYSSPGLAVQEQTGVFFLRKKGSNTKAVKVIIRDGEILGRMALRTVPDMNLNNTLFFAKLCGHDGKRMWVPFTLPCSYIQTKTEVEWKKTSSRIYDYAVSLDETKSYSKPQSESTKSSGCEVFFIDRKFKTAITHVDNRTLGPEANICVIANPGQTFKEALEKDGRFKNVERFVLNEKVEGAQGPKVEISDYPADHGEVVLQVSMSRSAQSSSMPSDPTSVESSSTEDGTTGEQDQDNSQSLKEKLDKLAEKLWKENVLFAFSIDEMKSVEQMLHAMEQCFRARFFLGAPFGPKDDRAKKFEMSVQKLAKDQVEKFYITGRPVSFSKNIYNFFDSVGYIKCGSVEATCFLISSSMIGTNYHVAKLTDEQSNIHHTDVLVFFNYENEEDKSSLANGHRLRPLSYEGNVISENLDYAFLFLEVPLSEETLTLGQIVRCKEPQEGNICLIGHPDGGPKHDDICPILPAHELNNRLAEKERQYGNDPSFCMCSSNIRNYYSNEAALSYDVGCMFEGASGSPIFDMDFNVVAIHMLGCSINASNSEKCRFMEVGVKFKAIIHDLERRERLDFIKEHFPCCMDERMETEDMC